MDRPVVTSFFDEATFTISYVVAEPSGRHAAIIDPVLGYDQKSGRTSTGPADHISDFVKSHGLIVDWILESHVHADHLTSAPLLKERIGGRVGIGNQIGVVQGAFKKIFNLPDWLATDGRQFDHLFADKETFHIGSLTGTVWQTPGHTPACVTYVVGDAAFVGDTLFMPDYGTARADFPGGNARHLYRSIRRILSLPDATRLFMCHDYGPNGRPYQWQTTVADEKAGNIHVKEGASEDQYVAMRTERDKKLAVPALLLPAVQVNMNGGRLPPAESNGVSYLKIPLNAFG
ncbi:MAG: MBL fold metallo-hydrolase [Alphaproteobacteria bacterium]|nr:MBL fold metallo-hydrolase [Alphaproteobacteria bacterium]